MDDLYRAIADPTRRAILDELVERDGQSLFELCGRLTMKHDIPLGEHHWLTVVSPEDPSGTELVLEPDEHPAANPFKSALVKDGIPFTSFAVRDTAAEYGRLESLGVRFTQPPVDDGTAITAVFDDTCGNLIQITQEKLGS